MPGLFRAEVLQHLQRDWLGSVRLHRPMPVAALTGAVLLTVVAAGVYLSLRTCARKVQLTGYVIEDPSDFRLRASLLAPASLASFIRVGQAVQLRCPARAGRASGRYSGAVAQVSRVPLSGDRVAGSPPVYRITVRLDRQNLAVDGQARSLLPGARVDAEVRLERRRLIEWMFDPAPGGVGPV